MEELIRVSKAVESTSDAATADTDSTTYPDRASIDLLGNAVNELNAVGGLHQQSGREQLVGQTAQRICQSLNLEEMLNTTVSEVR